MMDDEELLELAEEAQYDPDAADTLAQSRETIARLGQLALDAKRLRRELNYSEEKEEILTEYYYLLAKHDRTADEDARVEELKDRLHEMGRHSGDRRSRLMMEFLDEFIVERSSEGDVELTPAAKETLLKIWTTNLE